MALIECTMAELSTSKLLNEWAIQHYCARYTLKRADIQGFSSLDVFLKVAKPEDTYIFTTAPGSNESWEDNIKPLIPLGWIVYESPMAYNVVHNERYTPSIRMIILEKPCENN